MAKVPKHRRKKRASVLVKRTSYIKNIKSKPTPLYQKLKVNNRSLAKALSQEQQEFRLLFVQNNELQAEVQDLAHACNKRDLAISNILKNSKEMLQMLVTMSGYWTNVITLCQEFVSNQVNTHRASSSSSAGRRDSTNRRLSVKSPARGVVKPMVSGHTITKPTINLSRVNMPRVQNTNLSIIDEGPSTPERNSDQSVESRRSRNLSERIAVTSHRNEGDEERVIINRRTSRYSGGRLSSGRYSKRNSGRLSGGGGVAGRLSKRISDTFELTKSPRVTLQDVSRYLTNNQTFNVRLLSESSNNANVSSTSDTQTSDHATSSPEINQTHHQANQSMEVSQAQDDLRETSSESEAENVTARPKKSKAKSDLKRSVRFLSTSRTSVPSEPDDDPLEGPSWLYSNNSLELESEENSSPVQNESPNETNRNAMTMDIEPPQSPVSSLPAERRRSSGGCFRVPELPKRFAKPTTPKLNLTKYFDSPGSTTCNSLGISTRSVGNEADDNGDDEDEDDGNRRMNLCFITKRRGNINHIEDDDDDDDDETIMLNMRRQISESHQSQAKTPEPSERNQFDINELLKLTPFKPLLDINCASNKSPNHVEPEIEPTVTIQLTQKCAPQPDETVTTSRMSTIKVQQPILPCQENGAGSSQEPRRFSELTTSRLTTRIELPRLSELPNLSDLSQIDGIRQSQVPVSPDNARRTKHLEKRKRTTVKYTEARHSASDAEEEAPKRQRKKPGNKKKKSNDKDQDPSTAKVVLQKLNDTQRLSSKSETAKSERKNSDESVSSARSSMMSRADHSSDSESSTTSSNSRQTRPRRQKAPKNLQETNLKRKLRR